MDQIEPGSVSRSVALPPKMWEQIDEVAKDYASRSSYLRELVAADIFKQDGRSVSTLTQRKKLGVEVRDPDAFEALAQRIVEKLTNRPDLKKAIREGVEINQRADILHTAPKQQKKTGTFNH